MSAPNLIPHIRSALASLRPAERKVADMVLNDVDFAMRASITELAQRADVSEPSVTRFCRAIGAHGLRDFKMQLAQSVAGGMPYSSAAIARSDDVQTLMDKVGEAAVDGITHARGALDPAVVESAIAALGDVAFAISHSGRSVEVNESIQIAKERGATTIALTNVGSRLAWLVDIALLLRVPSPIDPNTPGVSRLVHLCIMDALAIGVALKAGPKTLEKMRHAKARLSSHEPQTGD
ncbi:MAG: SIS domain-containing protein [Burkholderia sp.]|nr:SIS domain-containing protein [Burkholderia sp.]